MSRSAIRAAIAGAVLLAAPLGAEAYTYHRAPATHGYAPMRGYGYRPLARGYSAPNRFVRRYGYGIGAAAAAVGYGAAYGYGSGYGYGAGYGAGYDTGYGYGAYAAGPYATQYAQPTAAYNCPPAQPVSTLAYVPVTTYKAVRVYYTPQQQPFYNVPPYCATCGR